MDTLVEKHYQLHMDALSPRQRVERCAAMFQWTRDLLGRQILAELGSMSSERLKWEVAKRLYCGDAAAQATIERVLADVSR
jgi:hypothetical protein